MQRRRQRGRPVEDRKARQGRAPMRTNCSKSWQKKAVPSDSGSQDTMPERQLWIPEGRMPSDKIRRSRIVAAQKKPCSYKIPLKRERWRREAEISLQCRIRPPDRIFARLDSFLARYDATKRESTVCMPPAPRESIVRRVVWRAGRYQGFRTDPARQEYSIEIQEFCR